MWSWVSQVVCALVVLHSLLRTDDWNRMIQGCWLFMCIASRYWCGKKNIIWMKMIMFRSSFETKCLMLLHCVIVFSQSLYENNDLKCNILNKESGDLSIKSLIEAAESRLKEVQINKEECSVKVNVLSKSYKDILRMFNTGEYPNGTYMYF